MTKGFTVQVNTTPSPRGSFDARYMASEFWWYVVYLKNGDTVGKMFVCRPNERLKDVLAAEGIDINGALCEPMRTGDCS